MNPNLSRLIASFATAAFLVACGGGGTGDGATTPAPGGGGGGASGPTPEPRNSLVAVAGRPGGPGLKDANGADARFATNAESGQAVDGAGNVYVADTGNGVIRRINPAGDVNTFASGFQRPTAIAFDAQGNLFVADTGHHRIARISTAGVVSTWAGSGVEGFVNGPAATAQFSFPAGVVVDANGTVYVSDTGNMVIRKITPDRVVSKLAGQVGWSNRGYADGAGDTAQFSTPRHLALDASGTLLVADYDNGAIRTVDALGKVGTLAKPGLPGGIVVRDGIVYVSQQLDETVVRIQGGVTTVVAGVRSPPTGRFASDVADGPALAAKFRAPAGLAFDAAGNLFIADVGTVRKLTTQGVVSTFAGSSLRLGTANGAAADASLSTPDSLAFDGSGNLLVSDFDNFVIRKIAGGVVSTFAGGDTTNQPGTITYPSGMLANAGKLEVVSGNRGVFLVSVDASGKAGDARSTGSFPSGISFSPLPDRGAVVRDNAGNLYVTDQNFHVVRKVDTAGKATIVAGEVGTPGALNGTGASARFNGPVGLAIDGAGNLFVADTGNHVIRRITPAGVVTTFAGLMGTAGDADNTGPAARFDTPWQLAFDAAGNLLVTDQGNGLVRRVTPGGAVSTVVGQRGKHGVSLGNVSTATLNMPSGILVGTQGEIYLTDVAEHMVLKITAP